jgi:hypothetical protein
MLDFGPAGVFAREIKPVEEIIDQVVGEAVWSAFNRLGCNERSRQNCRFSGSLSHNNRRST